MKINYDVVKRWINEAQEAASGDNVMVQVCIPLTPLYLYKCTLHESESSRAMLLKWGSRPPIL